MAEKAIARTWRGRVFIGVSLDGYIARPDSDIEWLTDPPSHIEHERVVSDRPALDWSAFIADIDHLVMGRGTYEKVRHLRPLALHGSTGCRLEHDPGSTADERITVAGSLEARRSCFRGNQARGVYVDGGKVIQAFLASGLIDEITVGIAPVLIGNGFPLFGELPGDIRLRLRAAHASEGGVAHATYDVVRDL